MSIFESHELIQIFPGLLSSLLVFLNCGKHTKTMRTSQEHGEKKNLLQPRKAPRGRTDRTHFTCELPQGCGGCSSTLTCNIVRFILRSYQQFTVGCSLLSKNSSINLLLWPRSSPRWGDSSVVLMISLTYAFPPWSDSSSLMMI